MCQIKNVLSIPALKQLVVMPDVHTGYDLPIGCVALLRGQISPSFVGYDIGCGMLHQNIGKDVPLLQTKQGRITVYEEILRAVPVGVGAKHGQPYPYIKFSNAAQDRELERKVNEIAPVQLGTLGAGNHFIEVGQNKKGEYGITIHSGSRNAGHAIASYYMALGRLLELNSKQGKAYLKDMNWALEYALANRKLMLKAVLQVIFGKITKNLPTPTLPPPKYPPLINETHNHAIVLKNGDVLHRKGATAAGKNQLGVIPINQRDGTYITMGLGNKEFLCSASHGAGRKMSRNKARACISPEKLASQMKGIICRIDKNVCDEGPDAYKQAETVIARQEGLLVKILDHFQPILVIKG